MNTRSILHGVYGGMAGGVVFGAMMGMLGMLPMIGKMVVGHSSATAGFLAHLMISAMIGAGVAVTLGRSVSSGTIGKELGRGMAYGGVWWVLGPVTLIPLMMGMGLGTGWNVAAAIHQLPSLMGHLLYGGILGITYAGLRGRELTCSLAAAA